jgi:hypothetical protein
MSAQMIEVNIISIGMVISGITIAVLVTNELEDGASMNTSRRKRPMAIE